MSEPVLRILGGYRLQRLGNGFFQGLTRLSVAFILEKVSSIGEKSGEQAGKNSS
jgi:hypothetical protein